MPGRGLRDRPRRRRSSPSCLDHRQGRPWRSQPCRRARWRLGTRRRERRSGWHRHGVGSVELRQGELKRDVVVKVCRKLVVRVPCRARCGAFPKRRRTRHGAGRRCCACWRIGRGGCQLGRAKGGQTGGGWGGLGHGGRGGEAGLRAGEGVEGWSGWGEGWAGDGGGRARRRLGLRGRAPGGGCGR